MLSAQDPRASHSRKASLNHFTSSHSRNGTNESTIHSNTKYNIQHLIRQKDNSTRSIPPTRYSTAHLSREQIKEKKDTIEALNQLRGKY